MPKVDGSEIASLTLHLTLDAHDRVTTRAGNIDNLVTTLDTPASIGPMPESKSLVEVVVTGVAGHSHFPGNVDRLRGYVSSDQLGP